MHLRKPLLPALVCVCVGMLYWLSAETTIQFVSGFKRPSWWEISDSLAWSVVSWLQVTHVIAMLLAAVPLALVFRFLPLSRPVATALVAALIGLVIALYQLLQITQSPVGEFLNLSEPLLLGVLVVDHLKFVGALPLLVWLLLPPSNHSLQARRP